MTLLSTYDFEGQTPGANASATSPWRLGSGSTNIVVSTAAKVHGTVGGRISSAASYKPIIWDETLTTAARVVDAYLTPKAISANAYVMALYDGSTGRGDVRINANRTVTIRNGTSAVATSTDALALDATYRFAWRTSTTGQELRVYEGESTTPLFTLTGALSNASHTGIAVGLAVASSGFSLDFDTIRIADDWLSPVAPAVPLATPGSWTFVPDAPAVKIDATWAASAGADHYEIHVEENISGVWTPFGVFDDSGSPLTLTTGNGLEAGHLYRGRIRAMPA